MRNFWRCLVCTLTVTVHRSVALLAPGPGGAPSNNDRLSQIRLAVQLSTASATNITAAHEACDCWSVILENPTLDDNDADVAVLAYALYAACLVRVGQDDQAVTVYDKALRLKPEQPESRMGKAQALQRLLKYSLAADEYQRIKTNAAAMGAATCFLRTSNLTMALASLEQFVGQHKERDSVDPATQGLLGVLQYLETGSSSVSGPCQRNIQTASHHHPLYRWVQAAMGLSPENELSIPFVVADKEPLISLIQLNTSPLDDPHLLFLDDKIHLHQLLSGSQGPTSQFWPTGVILPDEKVLAQKLVTENYPGLWIAKQRSGYGSHGNQLLSADEARIFVETQGSEYLLQRMVETPMLLAGRKFSLRIYVIYFSPTELFLSTQGLVKLASMMMADDGDGDSADHYLDPSIHMTNSGREAAMDQHGLEYFKDYVQQKGDFSYDRFWSDIRLSIRQVMSNFAKQHHGEATTTTTAAWQHRREGLGIPKIMGFDFVVDGSCKPWLVEVNRFPGMEPRDESDRAIKSQVVHDAWQLAGRRLGGTSSTPRIQDHPLLDLLEQMECVTSTSSTVLQRL